MEDLPGYTPQAISDILPIYRPQHADDHIRVYDLKQTSSSTQLLTLRESRSDRGMSYEIKSNKTGGFMNRKPHVVVCAQDGGQQLAEGRFDIHGTGTTISYPRLGTQRLELEDSLAQLLRTTINGTAHWWQPHPGNKDLLELTNETEEIVARFVYAIPASQRTGSWPEGTGSKFESKKQRVDVSVGELQLVDELAGDDSRRQEILCSAIMVIERAKRRAANMARSGPALKGSAAWGMTISPPGGFT